MNDTTVWCQNGSVTESQRELDDPETIRFLLRIGVLLRLNILPVGTGVLDGPETIRSSLRIGVSMRFEFLPVGVDVLDDPRSNKFCFLNGYWYVATRKANAFSSRTVEDCTV